MTDEPSADRLALRQVVLDCRHPRSLAEFYRRLLGWDYRAGDQQTVRTPQMLHLDLSVADRASLLAEHDRVLVLGGRMLLDRIDDEDEPLRVYADPAGHPFCVFVAPDHPAGGLTRRFTYDTLLSTGRTQTAQMSIREVELR